MTPPPRGATNARTQPPGDIDVRAATRALLAAREPALAGCPDPWTAAGRVILHLVARLLAESRALVPDDLHHLLAELKIIKDSAGHAAWPRLVALIPQLPLTAREDPPDDAAVRRILAPLHADYTALTSEHLGVLHEQLLDKAGTRKGSGSFYTRAQLGGPTVRRTLEPLTHDPADTVRGPDTLLSLRLCDPAMGAGNFLLAALRVLADLLAPALGSARARRLVATHCLHGVDRDPLAVELARLALWLEVGDPTLTPADLATNLRCGDALLGAWHHQVTTYPAHAWSREAPDDASSARLRRHRKHVLATSPAPVDPTAHHHDLWCALWFWPLAALDLAPTPASFAAPSAEALEITADLRRQLRFFHWELEFPAVFARGGFDAVVGNPPWEIQKPSSQEFFAAVDPGYRARGKQDALARQRALFERDPALEQRWLTYLAALKNSGNFLRHTFHRQGSADLSAYKLFLERAHTLLRPGGQLGLVVPSALYTDMGSAELRRLLLEQCRWRWLYGFDNRALIFKEIHRSFKFAVVIAEKGGRTTAVRAAFMRHDLADWAAARDTYAYPAAHVQAWSPRSRALLEIRHPRDLDVLAKLHSNGVPLADPGPRGWDLRYATELHTTNDSHRFIPRDRAEADGYHPDEYGRWLGPHGDILLPLYEGRMIGAFDASKKGWVRGKGRTAVWRELPAHARRPEPQYLLRPADAPPNGPKVAYMRICSATNARTVIATYLRDTPAGDSIFFFLPADRAPATALTVVGIFNSFAYDFAVRARVGGLNLSEFLMLETPLPARDGLLAAARAAPAEPVPDLSPGPATLLTQHLLHLACSGPWFAPEWLALGDRARPCGISDPGERERLRLRCIVDAVVAAAYGLDPADLRWILRDCDLPRTRLADRRTGRTLDPKGFWRIDRDRDPELRHTVLTLVAFDALAELLRITATPRAALAAFLGWQLPETLRLADHDLGHDDRARAHQPVHDRLAAAPPISLADSWAACTRHAAAIA